MGKDVMYDCLIFTAEKIRGHAVIRLKSEAFLFYADMHQRDEFLDFLTKVEAMDDINGLLLMNHEKLMDDGVVRDYIKSIFCEKSPSGVRTSNISKMFNSLYMLVSKMCEYTKPVVTGMVGEVNYEFLSSSFPSEARIASNDSRFINGALINGFPHIGTSPYFFGKILNPLRAKHLLLDLEEFSAEYALELGLITKVVGADEVEEVCLDTLDMYAEQPAGLVSTISTLANPCDDGLEEYMKNAQTQVLRFVYSNC